MLEPDHQWCQLSDITGFATASRARTTLEDAEAYFVGRWREQPNDVSVETM
jgi:hypothetical protein